MATAAILTTALKSEAKTLENSTVESLTALFKKLDIDNSGSIERDEIVAFFNSSDSFLPTSFAVRAKIALAYYVLEALSRRPDVIFVAAA